MGGILGAAAPLMSIFAPMAESLLGGLTGGGGEGNNSPLQFSIGGSSFAGSGPESGKEGVANLGDSGLGGLLEGILGALSGSDLIGTITSLLGNLLGGNTGGSQGAPATKGAPSTGATSKAATATGVNAHGAASTATKTTAPVKSSTSPTPATTEPSAPTKPAASKRTDMDADGPPKRPETYTVQRGDTLAKIADKFGIDDWRELQDLNKDKIGSDPTKLQIGTVLRLPDDARSGGPDEADGGTNDRTPDLGAPDTPVGPAPEELGTDGVLDASEQQKIADLRAQIAAQRDNIEGSDSSVAADNDVRAKIADLEAQIAAIESAK